MALKKSNYEKQYKCEYCGKSYSRESTLHAHMCQRKQRELQRNERRVQLGFYAFNQFYKLSTGTKKEKSYKDFCESQYYNAFVKFGSYVSNVKPLYPERYIDYVVTSKIKIDKWCDDTLYEKYVLDLLKVESVDTALERSIKHMDEWAENNNSVWHHYFKYVSVNRGIWDIRDGKISPWILLNSKTGVEFIEKLDDSQLKILYAVLDPAFWALKFNRQPMDVAFVKQIVNESKL